MVTAFVDNYGKYNIHLIPCREDNYTFLIEKNGNALLVDCSLYKTVKDYLVQKKIKLEAILITHHHYDHVDGIKALSDEHTCEIYCSEVDFKRNAIPKAHRFLNENNKLHFLDIDIEVINTPGHTAGHISFYIKSLNLLFCADTLFSLGCGRVFSDGSFKELYSSLKKIALLPEETIIYCAHEYTQNNANFLEKQNKISSKVVSTIEDNIRKKSRSIPTNLKFELNHNSFLNCQSYEEFFKLRTLKDSY